ncbi:MAG: twin-arginine translocation signal domain-containing protein, partial [Phycisphaerae bacterium]|nr:twin-arginine translocation signal domain-containing protein [Phycisphaerae bacterium]
MANKNKKTNHLTRRVFLRQSALAALALPVGLGSDNLAWGKASKAVRHKKVIVIGYDGMDPKLTTEMIQA